MNERKRKHALKSLKQSYKYWSAEACSASVVRATYETLRDFVLLSDNADEVYTMLTHYRYTGKVHS